MSCLYLQSSITWYLCCAWFIFIGCFDAFYLCLHCTQGQFWAEIAKIDVDLKTWSSRHSKRDSSPALKRTPLSVSSRSSCWQMQRVSDLQSADFQNIFGLMLPSADCYILPLSLLIELPSFLSFFAPAAPSGRWGGPPERGQGHFTRGYHLSNEERQGKSTPIWHYRNINHSLHMYGLTALVIG